MNRSEAAAAGHKIYVAEKPCKRGHKPIRYVSNGCCAECLAYSREAFNRKRIGQASGWPEVTVRCPASLVPILEAVANILGDGTKTMHHMALRQFVRNLGGEDPFGVGTPTKPAPPQPPAPRGVPVLVEGLTPEPPEWYVEGLPRPRKSTDPQHARHALEPSDFTGVTRTATGLPVLHNPPPARPPDNEMITVWRDGQWVQIPDPNPDASRD